MRFRFAVSKLVLAFASMLLARDCPADVVYSDLTAPLSLAGTVAVGTTAAVEIGQPNVRNYVDQIFSAGGTFALTSVTVGTYYYAALPGFPFAGDVFSPLFDVWLYSNYEETFYIHNVLYTENEPGTALEEVQQGLTAPNNEGLVTATSSLGTTVMNAGSLYWIVLTPANPDTLVAWGVVDGGPQSLEVDGRQITPEPSTFAFVTLAGGVALVLAWKVQKSGGFLFVVAGSLRGIR